jgi:hypothetical protein
MSKDMQQPRKHGKQNLESNQQSHFSESQKGTPEDIDISVNTTTSFWSFLNFKNIVILIGISLIGYAIYIYKNKNVRSVCAKPSNNEDWSSCRPNKDDSHELKYNKDLEAKILLVNEELAENRKILESNSRAILLLREDLLKSITSQSPKSKENKENIDLMSIDIQALPQLSVRKNNNTPVVEEIEEDSTAEISKELKELEEA